MAKKTSAKPKASQPKASQPKASQSNASKSNASKSNASAQPQSLNQILKQEITQLAAQHSIAPDVLEKFAQFVIENHKTKDPKPKAPKPLTLTQLKQAIYQYFNVKNTTELKRSGSFKLATDGMDSLNLSNKEGWEVLYRKLIGILPGEEQQQGYGCINGIDIFAYFKPWQIFGLEAQTASDSDIKTAYHSLSKIYHPDIPNTGDARIFDRLTTMYKSIVAQA
jgi:hypothetical protein